MIQRVPHKQPSEKWYVPFDFSDPLNSSANPDATEDIGSIESVAAIEMGTGADVTSDITDAGICQISGKLAYIWIRGGESGKQYKITVKIKTAKSRQVFELEAYMLVREE